MMTLLEAISPTARELFAVAAVCDRRERRSQSDATEMNFYACAYTWHDPQFGELAGHTVIIGADADAALKHFRSTHRHLTSASIIP